MTQTKITREEVLKGVIPDSSMRMIDKVDYCDQTLNLAKSLGTEDLELYVKYGLEFRTSQERKDQPSISSPYGDYMYFFERINCFDRELIERYLNSILDILNGGKNG